MRDLQLAFFKSGVPHIDTPQDHAFFATMYKFAEQHGVRYILTGSNLSTECVSNPVEWMYYQSDSIQLRDIHRKFGERPLVNFPTTSILWHKLYLPYVKGIRVVTPLNHIRYVKAEAMHFLQERFGWQPYPQKHFESQVHALLRKLLAAEEVRIRHAACPVLQPDTHRTDDARRGARAVVTAALR